MYFLIRILLFYEIVQYTLSMEDCSNITHLVQINDYVKHF